jgi:hypothetical protein
MDLFLDSNVIIGYVFYQADHWGTSSKNVIEMDEPKHYSYSVHDECFRLHIGKCSSIRKRISYEFFKAITTLKEEQNVELLLYDAEKEQWKIIEILRDITKSFQGDLNTLENDLRNYQWAFELESKTRQSHIKKVVKCHYRKEPYSGIYTTLKGIIQNNNDIEIILDAHHVAHFHSGLVLVTGDRKDILNNKSKILPLVRITEIKDLRDYQ